MSARRVTWLSVVTAVVVPCALLALAGLATNPDLRPFGMITGVLVMIVGLGVVGGLRPTWWLIGPALVAELVLLVVSGRAIEAGVLELRGERVPVVVTAAHSSKDKAGRVSWSCDLRRADGLPLPHPELAGFAGCTGLSEVGRTESLLVDPDGWVSPRSSDVDPAGVREGLVGLGVTALVFAAVTIGAGRLRLRAVHR